MFEELKVGSKVHYVQPNGTHSIAAVTRIHNQERGVVDLFVTRNDSIQDKPNIFTVLYSDQPKPYTWHWIEKE